MTVQRVELGAVAEFINGVAFKPEDWEDEGRPIIRIQNLNDTAKPFNRTTRVLPERNLARRGDLLVSWSASLGVFEWSGDEACVNQHIFKVIPNYAKVEHSYLRRALEASVGAMEAQVHGATMKHINRNEFLGITIPLPLLPEQRRIAAILDKADALRAKRRLAIAKLDQLLQSVFLEMFGDPVTNPKGWPMVSLTKVGQWVSGATPSKAVPSYWDGDIPWVSPKDMKVSRIRDAQDHVSESAFSESNLKLIGPDHLLIVVRGMILAHSFPTAINMVPIAINQDMKAIRPKQGIDVVYLKAAVDALRQKILSIVSTAGHGTRRLDTRDASEVLVPTPPISEQAKYRSVVERLTGMATQSNAQQERTNQMFASIQNRAFSASR